MTKPVFVADLPDSTLPEGGGDGAGVILWCPRCGAEYSATRGDYFWKMGNEPFTCRGPVGLKHRKTNMQLVRVVTHMVPVR